MITWNDYLKVWCEIHKIPFGGYDELPLEAYEKYIPMPGLGRELGEMFMFMDEFGYTGGEDVVLAQDVSLHYRELSSITNPRSQLGVPCPMTTWEEYIKLENVWADLL